MYSSKMYNDGDKVGFFAIVSKPEANLETVEEQAKLELKKKNNVSPEDTNAFGSFNLGKMFGKMYGFLTGMQLLTIIVGALTILAGMIAAAVVAIGAILYKIVQWFRGKDKDQAANATPEKKAEINKEAENAETQITTLVDNVNKGVSKDTDTVKQEITPAVIDTLGVKADQAKTLHQIFL
jgi:flagellar biosynthesis component FlhA